MVSYMFAVIISVIILFFVGFLVSDYFLTCGC